MVTRGALAALTALIALSLAATSNLATATPSLAYIIEVAADGNATVTVVFTASSDGIFYTYLPRFQRWNLTVWSGRVIGERLENSSAYFYYNATFEYVADPSRGFGMNITFEFPYAALYADGKGWFMSPLLGAPPNTRVSIRVTIDGLGSVLDVSLNDVSIPYKLEGDTIEVGNADLSSNTGGARLTVDFRPRKPPEDVTMEEHVNGTLVRVRAAPYYRGLLRTLSGILGKTLPILRELFGYAPPVLEFKPFLPSRMDLSALGYVMGEDINAGGEGPIYLNLALLRFREGYMETTVVHEVVHKALGALGVPANSELRWFHEGVAQYVSVEVCEKAGIDVKDVRDWLESSSRVFSSGLAKPGFVQRWEPSGNEGAYYAASYYVVASIARERGGLSYIRALASEIRRRGGVKTNQELVEAMSAAAGEDLTPRFREWGFDVRSVPAVQRYVAVLAAIALAAAAAFSILAILHRKRSVRCPYCRAEVPRGTRYCPYCGYPIEGLPEEAPGANSSS